MRRIVLLLLLVAVVAAVKFLPWWVSLAGAVALALGLRWFIPWAGKRFILSMFEAKSRALRGATAQVHALVPRRPPEGEDAGNLEYDPNRRWFEAEVTMTPKAGDGPFQGWEPGELRIVKHDAKRPDANDDGDDDACVVHVLKTRESGDWESYEGEKYAGPRTLLLHLGVQPGVSRLKFRYYFEDLGPITVPHEQAALAG